MKTLQDYTGTYHLVNEMLEAPELIRNFDTIDVERMFRKIRNAQSLMLTGEGSSRIFPAKNMIFRRLSQSIGPVVQSESANDLSDFSLDTHTVLGASNSGRTKELVSLFMKEFAAGHQHLYGITCNENHALHGITSDVVMLKTGKEQAVAATKSVMIQALFYDLLLSMWTDHKPNLPFLSEKLERALLTPFDRQISDMLSGANHVYFAGINNGVAEELALKTNETIRKNSAYFPGTYLLHGVEEVISEKDVIVLIDDLPGHMEKIRDIYSVKIGTGVIAISTQPTLFPTVIIPECDRFSSPYVRLAAGWKILAETGIALGIDLDKPQRARKIGNEF